MYRWRALAGLANHRYVWRPTSLLRICAHGQRSRGVALAVRWTSMVGVVTAEAVTTMVLARRFAQHHEFKAPPPPAIYFFC